MEAKEATPLDLNSGSSSPLPYSSDYGNQTISKPTVLSNENDGNIDSSVSGFSNNGDKGRVSDDDEDGGYLSGKEEFELPPEKQVSAEKDAGVVENSVRSSKVLSDDVEKGNSSVEGDGIQLVKDKVAADGGSESTAGGVEGESEDLNMNFDSGVEERGFDDAKMDDGKEAGEAGEREKIEVLNKETLAVEPEKGAIAQGVEEKENIGGSTNDIKQEVEPKEPKFVEAEGVKLTSEGDAIVETINVEALNVATASPPVVVVWEREDKGDVKAGVEALRHDSMSIVGNDENSLDPESAADSDEVRQDVEPMMPESVEADGVKLTPDRDSVVETINVESVNVATASPAVVVVGKAEEDDVKTGKMEVPVDHSASLVDNDENSHTPASAAYTTERRQNAEAVEPELVEADGVKLTSEGDSIVDTIKVESVNVATASPAIVVVGKMEGESKGLDVPVDDKVALVSNNESSHINDSVELTDNNEIDIPEHDLDAAVKKSSNIQTEIKPLGLENDAVPAEHGEKFDTGKTKADGSVDGDGPLDMENILKKPDPGIVQTDSSEAEVDGATVKIDADRELESVSDGVAHTAMHTNGDHANLSILPEPKLMTDPQGSAEAQEGAENQIDKDIEHEDSTSAGETDGMIFGSSEAAKQFIEEMERASAGGSHSGADSSHEQSQRIDGQIVTDSEEEGDTDEEGDGKELFDSAALAALLKAATGADPDGGTITITSQDGSRLFSVERPAGLGSSLRSLRPAPQPNRPNFFTPPSLSGGESENNLSEEERKKLEKIQNIRVKFLRLVHKLGVSPDENVAAQVLYRLALIAGRQTSQISNVDDAKRTALQLEAEGNSDLDFSLNILILGKSGVGKSATINSIFGEEKAAIDAFESGTTVVKEISGFVDGVKIRVFDTPGLKSSIMEQGFNRSVLSSVKKFTKKSPPDVVLYVDRLDAQTRDLNDLPLLRTITSSLGASIWRSAVVTLTHASSAPPDGPTGAPLSYEVFVTQRSHVVQQSIGHAVGDLRMMSPSLMNPVSLVENHPSCRKNREGQKILPNGQSWRPQLLLLCYSMKILSEASSLSKPQDPFDHRKLFGFRVRSPPLPYMLSSMLQSRAHPKLSSEQGGDSVDSDIDIDDLSDSDQEEEDEYDQLPPFKTLRKAQIAKLSKEQKKAYFDEYDYRVKLLQKKQWREELRRMREMKRKGKDAAADYAYGEEDADSGAAAPVAVPLPDMALPPSFDSDNPAYRYRFLEPTSQFLARPVLDTHGWDHDCGYDGVNLEHSLAIASRFPVSYTIQITKDKKDFNVSLDSSVAAKHREGMSSMVGFDIQSIGKQLAYIFRGETKFKNLKKNKTTGGISFTLLGENVVPGVKIEDQIILGKQYVLAGSAGAVRSQHDTAYGANIELQRRELDYPIGQVQSTVNLSLVKWRGDFALGLNSLAQFNIGRGSKVAVRAGINHKLSGQITVRTSSSEHLSLALAAVIPTAISIYRKLWPGIGEKYSIY